MKKVSFTIPCYNEEGNIRQMATAIADVMTQYAGKYEYEIIFRNNNSTDSSMTILRALAKEDKHIKVISNARNYGMDALKDSFKGRISGDVSIYIPCDFQEPPELIPEFIKWWENGYEVVCGVKVNSKEKGKYKLRQVFYKIIDLCSDVPQYSNMSGIVLISKRLLELAFESGMDVPIRYWLSETGCPVKQIEYEGQERRAGKSSYNIWRSMSFAIDSLITTSHVPLRIATLIGACMSMISFLIGLVYLVLKLCLWDRFTAGMAPMLIGMFFLGAVQLFFIGMVGEYVGSILRKVSPKNPPIVKELINFEHPEDDPYYVKDYDNNENDTV